MKRLRPQAVDMLETFKRRPESWISGHDFFYESMGIAAYAQRISNINAHARANNLPYRIVGEQEPHRATYRYMMVRVGVGRVAA